jgi:hypothetical protein
MICQIEFANDDVGMPCGKTAVAKCSDCGTAICSDCCTECAEILSAWCAMTTTSRIRA